MSKKDKKEELNTQKSSKKNKIILVVCLIVLILATFTTLFIYILKNQGSNEPKKKELLPLPKAEADPSRGDFGVDKNINIDTIDKYLGRSDTVYRDMRMLEDPALYENLGGNRFLDGYIKGFELIPLPYIIPVNGLPVEVGETYDGITLFYEQDGRYIANYNESMELLEKYFPKDKNIFLMCGGGGYAFMMKNFLISMGWDADKIYNIGGFWYYKGENKVDLKLDNDTYDFDSAPYINIDFNSLTKAPEFKDAGVRVTGVQISIDLIEDLEEKMSFQLHAYVEPNLASNKEVKWTSSDERIATVTDNGLVRGVKEGTATITVTTMDKGMTANCKVIVKKRITNVITLDDISKEINEIKALKINNVDDKWHNIMYDEDNRLRPEYDQFISGESGKIAYNKIKSEKDAEITPLIIQEGNIIKKLMDDKKSFIIITYRDTCGDRPYNVFERVPGILDKNNYSYIYFDRYVYGKDGDVLQYLGLDYDTIKNGTVIIFKEGKLLDYLDTDFISIFNEQDMKAWLTKYIELK